MKAGPITISAAHLQGKPITSPKDPRIEVPVVIFQPARPLLLMDVDRDSTAGSMGSIADLDREIGREAKLRMFLPDTAEEILRREAAETEARILAGENDFTRTSASGLTIRYVVPSWRRHPILRFRIAWARRRAS